jgi:DNA-binding response OmpR family regulator
MRILIVEDDRKVGSFLSKGLREEGYTVDLATDGVDGGMKARVYDYDLLLLDVMLPGKSGLEIVREARARPGRVPILLLTARDDTGDIVAGLDAGADDYLTKPFSFDVLLARIRALLRRGGAERSDRLIYGDIELDRVKHTAYKKGTKLELTPKEFQLLEFFMLNTDRVVRRTELLEKVWDLSFDPMSNVVDVHVSHLRHKLREEEGESVLHTIRGVGYRFQKGEPG